MGRSLSMEGDLVGYEPFASMRAVDAVNYSIDRGVEVISSSGEQLVNLGSGVNFFAPPAPLLDAVSEAIRSPVFYHDYDGPSGHLLGRAAVALHESIRTGRPDAIAAENVLVSCGSSAAMHLLALFLAAAMPKAELILPVPTFPMAGAAFSFAGIRVVEVLSRDGAWALPAIEDLESALTPEARMLYLNHFNNPTGQPYTPETTRELLNWAKYHHLIVIFDTVSGCSAEDLDTPDVLGLALELECLDDVFIISSLSKARSLPGLRVGWLISSSARVEQLSAYNDLVTASSQAIATPLLYCDMLCRSVLWTSRRYGDDMNVACGEVGGLYAEAAAEYDTLFPEFSTFRRMFDDTAVVEETVTEYGAAFGHAARGLQANWETLLGTGRYTPCRAWSGDFNTFVSIKELDGMDPIKVTTDIFEMSGVQLLPGPVFCSTPEMWQHEYGYWTRLSFALPESEWQAGLARLSACIDDLAR